MAPQPASRTAMASTTNLLFSAKSTRARIIPCPVLFVDAPASPLSDGHLSGTALARLDNDRHPLLSEHVVQNQRVRNHLLPWLEAGFDFLQIRVLGQHVAANDFHTPKSLVGRGNENK